MNVSWVHNTLKTPWFDFQKQVGWGTWLHSPHPAPGLTTSRRLSLGWSELSPRGPTSSPGCHCHRQRNHYLRHCIIGTLWNWISKMTIFKKLCLGRLEIFLVLEKLSYYQAVLHWGIPAVLRQGRCLRLGYWGKGKVSDWGMFTSPKKCSRPTMFRHRHCSERAALS